MYVKKIEKMWKTIIYHKDTKKKNYIERICGRSWEKMRSLNSNSRRTPMMRINNAPVTMFRNKFLTLCPVKGAGEAGR